MRYERGLRLAALACALFSCHASRADDLSDAQHQRDLAQAKRDTAQAQADEAKAKLGSFDTSGLPKGSGEASSLNIEAKILAYQAVDRIADKIADAVAVKKPSSVVIYSDNELDAVLQFQAFHQQATLLDANAKATAGGSITAPKLPPLTSDTSCTAANPAPAIALDAGEAGGGAALPLVGVALQVLSLFKVDKKISGQDVTVTDFALVTKVMGKLIDRNIPVIYPPSYLPGVLAASGSDAFGRSQTMKDLGALTANSAAMDTVGSLVATRRGELDQRAAAKGATAACKALFKSDLAKLTQRETDAKALKATIDQVSGSIMKVDDKTGVSSLLRLVIAETMANRFKSAHILQIMPTAAGGATLAKTNFFNTRFLFSGGAIVSYLLLDGATGATVLAGTVPNYGGFIGEDQLPKLAP